MINYIEKLSEKFYKLSTRNIIIDVPLEKLYTWNPLNVPPWPGIKRSISKEEIQIAIDNKEFKEEPIEYNDFIFPNRNEHIKRIAYFVVNNWVSPIEIDVGWEPDCQADHIIFNGNHRLGAAFFRGDPSIKAAIIGSVECLEKTLNVTLKNN